MIIPLSWLADYVPLPESVGKLTDRLTMIGHMLDKRYEVDGETVIDLELRGNRSDMFGLIGVARDVAAAFDSSLALPSVAPLPAIAPDSSLVTVQAPDLVVRFLAFELRVTVGPSPEWLVKRLAFYGMPSINNVVDITNYCMLETGEPMHAYDRAKLAGQRLILRRAEPGETMTTLLGSQAIFSAEDLVICDERGPQATSLIGGQASAITGETQEILLEAAVYNHANVRRSARRLNIRTEAGTRHEKLLDPNQVPFALERALYLLQELANARPIGPCCDFYPSPVEPKRITTALADIPRLTGIDVPTQESLNILARLGCEARIIDNALDVLVPTLRTDIEQSADIVEEIIRIYGYEKIPIRSLSGAVPEQMTSPMVLLEESVRDLLVTMQCNEVITSALIRNNAVNLYQQVGTFPPSILLENAPDSDQATLRPSLLPNLVDYARRGISFRQRRITYFEIGKIYAQRAQGDYDEQPMVGLIVTGETDTLSWNRRPRPLTVYDLKGIVEGLCQGLGIHYRVEATASHPALDPAIQGAFHTPEGEGIGWFGQLHPSIIRALNMAQPLFVAELSLQTILQAPKTLPQPYTIAPRYPPVIEDLAFVVPDDFQVGPFMEALQKVSPLIARLSLLDVFDSSRTIRVNYADPNRTLSVDDVRPIREQLIQLAQAEFGANLKSTGDARPPSTPVPASA